MSFSDEDASYNEIMHTLTTTRASVMSFKTTIGVVTTTLPASFKPTTSTTTTLAVTRIAAPVAVGAFLIITVFLTAPFIYLIHKRSSKLCHI